MKKSLILITALTLLVFFIPSVKSDWYCPIKNRDITGGTGWGKWGGQWKILCPSCGFYELASHFEDINGTHWKCTHSCCVRCVECGVGTTHCYCEESIPTKEECDALPDTSKIWYSWHTCNYIWEKQGEWIADWVSEGCYLYGREDNGGWGAALISQNTQITPYPKEDQRINVKFKVGQMGIHGPITDFTRLADTGIWLWMDFSEPQIVNSVEISRVELSIFLDFESANPLILPRTLNYQIRSETGGDNWLQVVWYYSKGFSGEGWIEGEIDLEPVLDYIEDMGVNLQQGNIYQMQAAVEGHYGTAEAWYDYLDYCYWVECNPDDTDSCLLLCDYKCGASSECSGVGPGQANTCCNGCHYVDMDKNDIINILDIIKVAVCFGTSVEEPTIPGTVQPYDPDADVNNDGIINILDIAKIAIKFEETCHEPMTCAEVGGLCERPSDCTDGYECYESKLDCTYPVTCCCVGVEPLGFVNNPIFAIIVVLVMLVLIISVFKLFAKKK